MAVITTGNFPKALWPGIHKWAMGKYNEYATEHDAIFDMESSKKAYEEDVEQTGFGLVPIKPQGDATSYDSHQQGFTKRYTHVARSMGYIVTFEEMDDNQYKGAFDRAAMLTRSFRVTKETVAGLVLIRAFTAAYAGGDGKELLATDHPSLAGDWSNELATPAALSEASLEDLDTQIEEAVDSRGLPIQIRGQRLIVPPAEAYNAERILKSTLQNDTANNAVNAVRSRGRLPKGYMVSHFIGASQGGSDTAWFIKTDVMNGMTGFNRNAFAFTRDNDFDTMNLKAKGYERYSFGWTDPRGMYGSAGA